MLKCVAIQKYFCFTLQVLQHVQMVIFTARTKDTSPVLFPLHVSMMQFVVSLYLILLTVYAWFVVVICYLFTIIIITEACEKGLPFFV